MLTDAARALDGINLDDPIRDFSSWFGKYENEMGDRRVLSDSVFFNPLFLLNLN